jgi:hypothetical protein
VVLLTLAQHQAARAKDGMPRERRGALVCTSRDVAASVNQPPAGSPMSSSTVARIWRQMDLKPWRWHSWLTPTDPDFAAKSRAICRLYRHPPQDGTLLCFDEKPGIHVRERKYPGWPLAPGHIALTEFEYIRHGTLDLLAAFEVSQGWVFGRCYHRHRAVELVYFLDSLHRALPVEDYGVLHLISDNAKSRTAPETLAWMDAHPGRLVWHFLPKHGSWLNQIEIWFSVLQRKCLTGGSWHDFDELKRHILAYISTYNRVWAHPYQWTYKGLPLVA